MLLPLLLETGEQAGEYTMFDDVLNELEWENEEEKLSFDNYYNLLKTLREQGRQLWQLDEDAGEYDMLLSIAADTFEHAAFAKVWLEFAYNVPWHHYQEQMPMETMRGAVGFGAENLGSTLHDAVPNPAGNSTTITVELHEADAIKAHLVVRNMMGQPVYLKNLQQGNNVLRIPLTELSAGVYTYSLVSNGKALQTKRLAIVR